MYQNVGPYLDLSGPMTVKMRQGRDMRRLTGSAICGSFSSSATTAACQSDAPFDNQTHSNPVRDHADLTQNQSRAYAEYMSCH